MQLLPALLLLLLPLLLLDAATGAEAASVGDPERRALWQQVEAAGSGSGASGACPNVTTFSAISPSSARVTSAGAGCRSETVSSASADSRVALDASGKGVVALQSVPADVQLLTLRNNSIRSLDGVAFAKGLLTLDLSSNALTTLANASLPSTLTLLNMSRNPITSLSSVQFPSSLVQLDVTRAKLTTLEKLAFPDALERLNLSGNAITRIAGVTFPKSLVQLSVNSLAPVVDGDVATDQDSVLEEFEVRQIDATTFAAIKTALFDVAVTSKATCSDTRARPVYVRDTMLCVLADDIFKEKYGTAASNNGGDGTGTGGGSGASGSHPLVVVDESFDQSRSWFLLVAAAALGGFVACIFGVAVCRACGRGLGFRAKDDGDDVKLQSQQQQQQQQELLRRDRGSRGRDNENDDNETGSKMVV